MKVLQILPNVPPVSCGIGDYGWLLAGALRETQGHEVSFLSAGTKGTVPAGPTEFPVTAMPRRSASGLLEGWMKAGRADVVVLHVSLYGYQRRAVPFWLASGMEQLAARPGSPAIVLMFHELYAPCRIMSSACWLQPFQKRILRRLQRTGHVLRTNRRPNADWLEAALLPGIPPVTVMPVFSNLGELPVPPPLANRLSDMNMFGAGMHGGVGANAAIQEASGIGARLGMTRLHVFGTGIGPPETAGPVEIVRHPPLPAEELSALLSRCRLAYSAYNPFCLAKSGVLAAYAAHGLAVLQAGDELPETLPDGLSVGRELLAAATVRHSPPEAGTLQAAADRLHAWYESHDLAHHSRSYANDIQTAVTVSLQMSA